MIKLVSHINNILYQTTKLRINIRIINFILFKYVIWFILTQNFKEFFFNIK